MAIPDKYFKYWIKKLFKGQYPFLELIKDEQAALLHQNNNVVFLTPPPTSPLNLSFFKAKLSQEAKDDLNIAMIRRYWPNAQASDYSDLYDIFLRRNH